MAKKIKIVVKSNRISLNDATIVQTVDEIKAMTPIGVSTTAIIRAAVVNQLARMKAENATRRPSELAMEAAMKSPEWKRKDVTK